MPTVTFGDNTTDTFAGCEDGELRENVPTYGQGDTDNFSVAKFEAGSYENAVIRFTAIAAEIPAGATITDVRLGLSLVQAEGGPRTTEARRLLRNWTEGAEGIPGWPSWNQYSSGNDWGTPGGTNATDRESTVSGSVVINALQTGYVEFTGAGLISDVQGWLDGTFSNHGWHLEDAGGSNEEYRIFTSSEGVDGSRPYLEVTYTLGGSKIPQIVHHLREQGIA